MVPLQSTPFPEYPELQVQLKLPIVLLHIAFLSQLLVFKSHSFSSSFISLSISFAFLSSKIQNKR